LFVLSLSLSLSLSLWKPFECIPVESSSEKVGRRRECLRREEHTFWSAVDTRRCVRNERERERERERKS
jgi:hypothetical protein